MLSAMDDAVGVLLDKLAAAKIDENTLIFFVSDNGGPSSVNGSNNAPLRGNKTTTWDGGIRVPFFVQWKARLPKGRRTISRSSSSTSCRRPWPPRALRRRPTTSSTASICRRTSTARTRPRLMPAACSGGSAITPRPASAIGN